MDFVSVSHLVEKIKMREKEIFIALLIVLIALFSYGLGRLSRVEEGKMPVRVNHNGSFQEINNDQTKGGKETLAPQTGTSQAGLLVGSRNGTRYHFPWCSGAQRIKEDNKVWFSSREEAEKAGYTAAANCPGL